MSDARLTREATSAGFQVAVLLDATGHAIAVAPPARELHGVDLAVRYDHLAGAVAGRATVSNVVPSAAKAVPIVGFALPVDHGRLRVVSAGLDLRNSPLDAFLATTPITGGRGYLVDAASVPLVLGGRGANPGFDGIDLAAALEGVVVEDGVVGAAASVPGTPWRLLLTAPEDTLLAPARTNDAATWWLLASVALMALLALVGLDRVAVSRRASREAQAASEEQFRLTIDHAPIGMALLALDGRFLRTNGQLERMLGHPPHLLPELTLQDITRSEDLETELGLLEQLLSGDIESYGLEKRCVRHDGSLLWTKLSVSLVRDRQEAPSHFVAQIEDISQLRAAYELLEQRALHDPLTGLANRSLLHDRLAHALRQGRRDDSLVGVAYCDLDYFKQINDTRGHDAGDAVLRQVAARMERMLRAGDTVARIGGDEFVLVLDDVASTSAAAEVLERVRTAVQQPIEFGDELLTVSMSAGLAVGDGTESADRLLRDADIALYLAKEKGRARWELFSPAAHG